MKRNDIDDESFESPRSLNHFPETREVRISGGSANRSEITVGQMSSDFNGDTKGVVRGKNSGTMIKKIKRERERKRKEEKKREARKERQGKRVGRGVIEAVRTKEEKGGGRRCPRFVNPCHVK